MKIEIDPTDLGVSYDEEGNVGPDFRDAVVRELVRTLTQRDAAFYNLAREVHDEVREQVTQQVGQIVQEAIATPVQRTTTWGETTGEALSVRELIRMEIEKWFNAPANNDRYSSSSKPRNLAELISQETGHVLSKEMTAAARKAREDIKDSVMKRAIEAAVTTLSA